MQTYDLVLHAATITYMLTFHMRSCHMSMEYNITLRESASSSHSTVAPGGLYATCKLSSVSMHKAWVCNNKLPT